jgi:hypothetical protein
VVESAAAVDARRDALAFQELDDARCEHRRAGGGITNPVERLREPPKSWIVSGALPVTIGTPVSQCAEIISTPFGRGSIFAIARHAAPASPVRRRASASRATGRASAKRRGRSSRDKCSS